MARVLLRPAGAGDGGGEPVEVELRPDGADRAGFTVRGGELLEGAAELGQGAAGVLRIGERVVPFFAATAGGEVEVWLGGETYRFALPGREENGAAAPQVLPPGGEVTAPMPGLILRVLVRAGEAVEEQAALVVVESMKMQLTVSAPAAGRVKELLCETGQMVDVGAPLLRLEPAAEAPP